MPFVLPRWNTGKPPAPSSKKPQMPPPIVPGANPRAPPPVQPGALQQGTKIINTETVALGSSPFQGQTYNLPLMDINAIELDVSGSITGTTTAAVDTSAVISYITVADSNGSIFMNIPGGNFVYDNYSRYSTPAPTAVQSNSTAAGASSFTPASLTYLNVRIPASLGGTTGCQLTIYYSPLAVLPGATGATVSNQILVHFGATDGYRTRYAYQSLNLVTGDNLLQTQSTPQSNLISEVFMRNLPSAFTPAGAYGDINFLRITTNGQTIEPNLSGRTLYSRDIRRFGPSGTLPFESTTAVLGESSLFALNSSSEFDVNMAAGANAQFVWVWYEAA
jgi:hypothetical protein